MYASVKSKPLSKSVSLGTRASSRSKTLKNEAKSLAHSSTLDNIEIEYIKNLQQQVYFLELECNYLRQQLNLNGLQTSLKYDVKSQQLKNEMLTIQVEKESLEKSLHEENQQKENVINMLEHTEKSFHQERELLLKEINLLKKQKLDLEENLISKNVELGKTRENLTKHHLTTHDSMSQLVKLESQIEVFRKDNASLRAELNDSRAQLIARDNLIKDLQHQLTDPYLNRSTATQLKIHEESLNQELDALNVKINELKKENSKLSSSLEISLKQNEADLILAKKNADLNKSNLENLQRELENEKHSNSNLKNQVEQFRLQERLEIKNQGILKKRIADLEDLVKTHDSSKDTIHKTFQDQLSSKHRELENEKQKWSKHHDELLAKNKTLETKIHHLNDTIDKHELHQKANLETIKTKSNSLQAQLDEALLNLNHEKGSKKALQSKIETLVRQEAIHTNLISSLKVRINEFETELHKHTHIDDSLHKQLKDAHDKIHHLENEKRTLKSEIDLLHIKLKEIDRLKQLEDLVQSQRWGDLGELAESMKSLSRTMAGSTI